MTKPIIFLIPIPIASLFPLPSHLYPYPILIPTPIPIPNPITIHIPSVFRLSHGPHLHPHSCSHPYPIPVFVSWAVSLSPSLLPFTSHPSHHHYVIHATLNHTNGPLYNDWSPPPVCSKISPLQ